MAQTASAPRSSEDEYVERERKSEVKHELVNGEVVAMAGGTPKHNAIAANVVGTLRALLKSQPCLVFQSDQRVYAEATGLFTYPDITVACEGLRFHPKYDDTLLNPRVVFEVLSDSTEAYDRGAKFAHYRTIASLDEYVLVAQREQKIEHYRRIEGGQWILSVYEGESASVALPSLGTSLPLSEVYDKLDLLTREAPPGAS